LRLLRSLPLGDVSSDSLLLMAVKQLWEVCKALLDRIVAGVFSIKVFDVRVGVHFHEEVHDFESASADEVTQGSPAFPVEGV